MTIVSESPVSPAAPNSMSAPQREDADTLMRILVIEDDRDAADYLIKGLREHGYSVDHAADGREGLLFTGEQPIEQPAGTPALHKWVFLVSDPTVTGIIIGQTLPAAESDEAMRAMASAVCAIESTRSFRWVVRNACRVSSSSNCSMAIMLTGPSLSILPRRATGCFRLPPQLGALGGPGPLARTRAITHPWAIAILGARLPLQPM